MRALCSRQYKEQEAAQEIHHWSVILPRDSSEDEHKAAVDHVPLAPGPFVDKVRNEAVVFNTNGLQERLLPEGTTSLNGSKGKDGTESQDAFDRTGDDPKCEGVSVVFVPGLHVKSEKS